MTDKPTTPIVRRTLLRGAGLLAGGLAAPALLTGRARAADQLTVADNGGPYGPAFRKAFYDPFEQATGTKVVNVVHPAEPTAQFRSLVEAKSYIWDVALISPGNVWRLVKPKNFLEPLGITAADAPGLMSDMIWPGYLGIDVFATAMAYRTDKYGDKGPQSWADFWDVQKFPGRRSFYKQPNGPLEIALMADGVEPAKLYPLDVDRAFKSLDKLRKYISVWWTSGAQSTQLLQSGEVDMLMIWNARAQAAIDGGAPAKIVWNQGLYSSDGWSIPLGSPRTELAKQFVKFCIDPDRQAVFTEVLAYGPTNLKAYDKIAPARAALLPTYPPNLKLMRASDDQWWGDNFQRVAERFEDWLLSG
jgi:putative spermidine/putrescine transport system substrate-binding protein